MDMRTKRVMWIAALGMFITTASLCGAQPQELATITAQELGQNLAEYSMSDWGPNTYLTCYLMAELPIGQLFSENMQFWTVVEKWKKNCESIPAEGRVSAASVAKVKEALGALSDLIKARDIQWSYKALYAADWDDAELAPIKRELENMKNAGVNLAFLTFTHQGQLDDLLGNLQRQGYNDWELADIFWTPATPQFKEAAINAVNDAMYECWVLIGVVPDVVVSKKDGTSYHVADPQVRSNMCCSRTTRKCVDAQPLSCTMCGLYCCLGSGWCS